MYTNIFCENVTLFSLISVRTRTVRTNDNEVDRGNPSGHSRRGLDAIRTVCRAWRALKVLFFPAALDNRTISPGFLCEAFF